MAQRSVQQRCSPIYNRGLTFYSHVENKCIDRIISLRAGPYK